MEKRNEQGQTLEEFLAAYDATRYRNPSNTVDMVLMTVSEGKLTLLLIKRKNHPFIGDWALPGGFIDFKEDMEKAVMRELEEETNITDHTYFRQLYTFGNADRDPRTRIITTAYLSLTPEDNIRQTKAQDDAADAAWFSISKEVIRLDGGTRESRLSIVSEEKNSHMIYLVTDEAQHNYMVTKSEILPESNCQLAADHIKAVNMAVDLVQNRAASTGILFNLLPEECTLREIQNVYEAVTGHKTDTGNFRRDIKKMLKATGNTKMVKGKPAALYSFNPMYQYLEENL